MGIIGDGLITVWILRTYVNKSSGYCTSESRESCHLACPPSAPGSLRALTLLVSQRASGIDVPRIVLAMQHRSLFLKPTESEYPFYQQTRYFVGTSAL